MAPFARQRGVDVQLLPQMRRPVRPIQDFRAVAHLVRRLRVIRPTVVHTHTAKAGAVGRLAAVMCQVPIVVHTFHGHIFDGYFSPRKTRAFIHAERLLASRTDVVLSLSRQQRHDLVEKYRIAPEDKVRVLPLGLELDRFLAVERGQRGALRAELGLGPETQLVLAVGRLVLIKRFDLLIEAFARVVARGVSAHLAIAGNGSPDERARLEAIARPIADKVHFLGWREDQDVLYRDADLVALTSDNEGTPVAVIEALASGVQVVATRVGGVEDIVSDATGTLVEPGRVESIAEALEIRLRAPKVVSDSDRRAVGAKFSHHRLIRDVTALYDELIARKLGVRGSAKLTKEVTAC